MVVGVNQLLQFLHKLMRCAFAAHFAKLIERKRRLIGRLLLENFVVFVVLSDVPKGLTLTTLESCCLSWSFFLFACHSLFLNLRAVVYKRSFYFARVSHLGDLNPGPTVYKTVALAN